MGNWEDEKKERIVLGRREPTKPGLFASTIQLAPLTGKKARTQQLQTKCFSLTSSFEHAKRPLKLQNTHTILSKKQDFTPEITPKYKSSKKQSYKSTHESTRPGRRMGRTIIKLLPKPYLLTAYQLLLATTSETF
ncbi:hypothetical protein ABZP36_012392 [Zizania latifolia]